MNKYNSQGFSFPHVAMSSVEAQHCFEKYIQLEQKYDTGTIAFKTHTALPWVRDVCLKPEILDVIEELLGPNILCWSSTFFTKKPDAGQFVSMHEDSLYFQPTEPDNIASIWIALNPAKQDTGCLEYVPGSHRQNYSHQHVIDKDNLLPKGQTVDGTFSTVPVELNPGEFTAHHIKLLHKSSPNYTKNYRVGLVVRYCKPSCKIKMFSNPSAITARGTNTNQSYWQEDYIPKEDFDIAGIKYIQYTMNKDFKNE